MFLLPTLSDRSIGRAPTTERADGPHDVGPPAGCCRSARSRVRPRSRSRRCARGSGATATRCRSASHRDIGSIRSAACRACDGSRRRSPAGHRASEVVPASEADLRALLDTAPSLAVRRPPRPPSGSLTADLLAAVRAFDGEVVTRRLLAEWARLGPLEFLTRVPRAAGARRRRRLGDRRTRGAPRALPLRACRRPAAVAAAPVRRARHGSARGPELPAGRVALARAPHGGARARDQSLSRAGARHRGAAAPARRDGARSARPGGWPQRVRRHRGPRHLASPACAAVLLPRRTALLVGGEGAPAGLPGVTTHEGRSGAARDVGPPGLPAAPEPRSVEEVAAVHVERLAGDRARQVGGEEHAPRRRSPRSRGCGAARCAT